MIRIAALSIGYVSAPLSSRLPPPRPLALLPRHGWGPTGFVEGGVGRHRGDRATSSIALEADTDIFSTSLTNPPSMLTNVELQRLMILPERSRISIFAVSL